MKERKIELFNETKLRNKKAISSSIHIFYPQERDWTCSIACIRTILGAKCNLSEDMFINNYKLQPGPLFSKDIKEKRLIYAYDVVYGCDEQKELDDILDMMKDKYNIMVESMYGCSHWMVLIGYYPLINKSSEFSKLLFYDPYYDEIKLIRCDEFVCMWRDGNNNEIIHDFIAIK